MLFSSLVFLFTFLPITLLVYYLVPRKVKNVVLLIASLIFYAWGRAGLYLPDADFHSVQLFLRNGHCIKSRKKIAGAQSDLYDRCKPVYSWIFQILRIYRDKFKCDPSGSIFHNRKLELPTGISFLYFPDIVLHHCVYRGR